MILILYYCICIVGSSTTPSVKSVKTEKYVQGRMNAAIKDLVILCKIADSELHPSDPKEYFKTHGMQSNWAKELLDAESELHQLRMDKYGQFPPLVGFDNRIVSYTSQLGSVINPNGDHYKACLEKSIQEINQGQNPKSLLEFESKLMFFRHELVNYLSERSFGASNSELMFPSTKSLHEKIHSLTKLYDSFSIKFLNL